MKHKILVLSDFNAFTEKTLKNSVDLAKVVNGDINLFYVKKPTDIVKEDNQLSAIRAINKDYLTITKEIKDVIAPIAAASKININHKFIVGNIKNEIIKHINEYKPDTIVLGKRKPKVVSFIGDKITQHVLKNHAGTIMIVGNQNTLEPNKTIEYVIEKGDNVIKKIATQLSKNNLNLLFLNKGNSKTNVNIKEIVKHLNNSSI